MAINWKGVEDSTPSSMPAPPDKMPEPRRNGGGDSWKGLDDGTPSSRPTPPDKQP